MRKIISILIFLFTLTGASAQKIVKVGAFNFYPGVFKDTDGVIKGFYVDALNELGELENIKFIYEYGSWDEGLKRLKDEEVDLLTSVAVTEERLQFLDYGTTPLLTVWGEVYINMNSEINGILDLEGKTVAVMKSDFNGAYLKQLTTKLSINCIFIETTDFEEVFNLILAKKVDAGVVNNTFGSPKSEEYGLLSSGIIFNPFDIFFAVKKDNNVELLEILNKYLHNWKYDRNSIFNVARQKWSHEKVGEIEVFPEWLEYGIYSIIFLVLVLIIFIALLRYKVRKATEKVNYSEALFKSFMENTPAFVYIKDNNLNHIYRNKMVDTVNRIASNDKISSAKTVFEPDIVKLVEKTDRKILNSELEQTDILYSCNLKGNKLWLHDYKFYLELPNGNPAVGGISFDITQLKETELELIRAKDKAEESDRLKSAFLANMSHEIRTPMNGILGFAELLKEPNLKGDKQQEYVEIIEKSGTRMLNIINDIVDLSKIESGQIDISKKNSNINKQIEYIHTFFKPEVAGINFVFKNSLPDEEAIIETDTEKLFAILTNLVKNAIKFTNRGSIEFGYEIKNGTVEFFVKDTGIGIEKSRCEAIFERFVQADIIDKMARQGAGLGLSITKAYVELLGGKIWVESEVGLGSTFYFTLPYNSIIGGGNIKAKIVSNKESLTKDLKILIVEDDETSASFISIVVKKISREIIITKKGNEAVEICRNHPNIDLILMDIQMPEMGGHEATRKIREFNKDVVIIAQTAYGLSGDREKAINSGCNDYISKPIHKDKLLMLIEKCLKKD